MEFKIAQDFLIRRIQEFIEIMSESHNNSNGKIVMTLFALQRCSLLFRFDQFGDGPYTDFKLVILRDLTNWATFQTPLYIINIQLLKEVIVYLLSFYFWTYILILFTNLQIKRLLKIFFTFYQLLVVIPSLVITQSNLFIDGNFGIGIISFSSIILCYLIYFIIHRNYQLPQSNLFIRRFSYYNLVLVISDIGVITLMHYVSEILQAVIQVSLNFLFLIDAFIIKPYQNQINRNYVSATSVVFCISVIKLLSFQLAQDEIFFFILLLTPLFSIVMTQFYQQQIYNQIYSLTLNDSRLLLISDIISLETSNPILVNSILTHLRVIHKIVIGPENQHVRIQQTILQLFHLEIEAINNGNDKVTLENVLLYKIMFITITCKKTQLGYIELKSFETISVKQSFYFHIISQLLQGKIARKSQKIVESDVDKRLSLPDIRKAELLYEESIDRIINILDTKIKFWMDLNKGYQRIEHLAENAIQLSEKIWTIRDQFFLWFHIDPLKLQQRLIRYNALELKLLAIIYSAILNDYHATLDIEQRIEEIMAVERNLQTENIINSTLLNDELVMIATSFAKQRGIMLNKNRGQLAKFFGYDEKEFQNINHVEQLMPTYIQQIHDQIITRYMKKGYTIMTEQTKEVYIKMKDNFIKAANISLLHMFENDTDYIITGALQKVKQNQDFIIFDRQGKILGITEQAFRTLGQNLQLDSILQKGHIYFWFNNIFNEIAQSKEDLLQQSDQYQKAVTKTQIIFPIKGFQQLCQEHEYTRACSTTKNQESAKNYLTEINDTEHLAKSRCDISTTHFLKEQNIQFMNDFMTKVRHSDFSDQNNPYSVKYFITFNVLGNDLLPVFVMQIMEIEKKIPTASQTTGGLSYGSFQIFSTQNDPFTELEIEVDIEGEKSQIININPPLVNKINNVSNFEQKNDETEKYPNYSSEQYKLVSPRGNNKENLILNNEDYEEDDEEKIRGQENAKSSSQVNNGKKNIEDVIQQNREQDNVAYDNGGQSQQSSATSDRTQISVFNILRHLQYTSRYQTTLIKVLLNTVVLILLLSFLMILQLVIARTNTNTLQTQIPLVRIPDKFNRLYCTFTVIGQMDQEMKLLNINHGDYYAYWIKQEGSDVRLQLLPLVVELKNEFSKFDQQGKLSEAKVVIINQFLYLVENITLLQFTEMVDEYTQVINTLFSQNTEESVRNEQVRLLFLKANLISLINLISNLVENIVTDFFNNITNYQFIYIVFLLVQLLVIIIAVLFQFQLWADPYIYKQNILLLICRVPEKEIELLLLKYKTYRDLLQYDICMWKQVNYFKEFFTCRISQLKKIQKIQSQPVGKKSKQVISRATVNSRIQDTQYSILHVYVMLFFFWMILTSYVLSSFLFQNSNMNNSQPELNLCMQFVRFKQEFDSSMIISQFIKNQPLLSDYQKKTGIYSKNPEYQKPDGFFHQLSYDLIEQFARSLEAGKLLYSTIYDNIVASTKISSTNKNVLLGLYQDDLCSYIEDELPFCSYENGKFTYFPDFPEPEGIVNNRERLRQGFNGLYQEIQSLFASRYVKELNGVLETNQDEILEFIESAEYIQLLLPYFFDLNKAIVKFYATIIASSIDILETDYLNYLAYYVAYGIVAMLIFLVIVIWQAKRIQRQIRAVRQALVLLPHESLLDVQTYNAIKRFEQQM